ncbi:MAG: RlmE family RNA methyltransferase [Thermoplasmata archaeon]|nr:MAG: RlmE family RNA methyltransferase [Thermoplasmata archaeon]
MSKRWVKERKRDGYYKQAKKAGYRSRSAYKLKQMNDRYNIISPRDTVIDLGAAPGGWLQVAKEIVGPKGMVVGVDIQKIEPLEGVTLLKGDMTRPETMDKLRLLVTKADVVISDMSPNITGNYSMDHARSIGLAEKALETAVNLLKEEGNFLVKVFQGDLYDDYLDKIKSSFRFTKAHSPKASRKSSSEIYLIGKGFFDL